MRAARLYGYNENYVVEDIPAPEPGNRSGTRGGGGFRCLSLGPAHVARRHGGKAFAAVSLGPWT